MYYVQPFIKWAGSKRNVSHFLAKFLPANLERYCEPFLGSGSLFFYLAQTRPKFDAILSDSNEDLINVYRCIRDEVKELIELLKIHQDNYYNDKEKYYYFIRDILKTYSNVEGAARLLFLNKTCYNGLYRVNKSGTFNVPHGTYMKPTICNENRLLSISNILRITNTSLVHNSFENITSDCSPMDCIYFDPPYLPITKTAKFKDYTKENFDIKKHILLKKEFDRLVELGCIVLLSNSDSPIIKELYRTYKIMTISISRTINRDGNKRKNHRELLIVN